MFVPFAAAFEAAAPLVECAEKTAVSTPDFWSVDLIQRPIVAVDTGTGQIRTSAGHSPTVIDFIGPLCWALRGFRRMNDVPEDVDPDGHYLGELFPA
jgi:hypothetical protein